MAARPDIDERTAQLVSKGRWQVPGYKVRIASYPSKSVSRSNALCRRDSETFPSSKQPARDFRTPQRPFLSFRLGTLHCTCILTAAYHRQFQISSTSSFPIFNLHMRIPPFNPVTSQQRPTPATVSRTHVIVGSLYSLT